MTAGSAQPGGDDIDVNARQRIVDTTFVGITVPSMRPPLRTTSHPRSTAYRRMTCPPHDARDNYVIVGAGKTAMDTCLWLLRHGVGTRAADLDQTP